MRGDARRSPALVRLRLRRQRRRHRASTTTDAVCIKVETHNHPSAIEPYGGAGTGIGGVIRDILGTGLGARPIANTDVFCFGPPDMPAERRAAGLPAPAPRAARAWSPACATTATAWASPRSTAPSCFDARYVGNPLVFCGSRRPDARATARARQRAAGRRDRGGRRPHRPRRHPRRHLLRRVELHAETRDGVDAARCRSATRSPRRRCSTSLLRGARRAASSARSPTAAPAGFSSAVGEMARRAAAPRSTSTTVPLKYAGLRYDEIWISEAQERMVARRAAEKRRPQRSARSARPRTSRPTVLGTFTGTRPPRAAPRADASSATFDLEFLHDGLPRSTRRRPTGRRRQRRSGRPTSPTTTRTLLALLAHPDIASKEWVIRQYDHEVQAGVGRASRCAARATTARATPPCCAPKLGSAEGS